MPRQRRTFSVQDKFEILQEAEHVGLTPTLRKHDLSHSVFLKWKQQFNDNGTSGLQSHYKRSPEVRALEDENARLRRIIANQALELEFKAELLKKSDSLNWKRQH